MCKINNKCKYNDIRIIKKALFYLNPYKFKFFVSVALTVTAMFLATLQPFMFGRFIDYIGLKDKYLINKTLLAMGAVFLAQLILGLFYNYLMAIVANNVEVDVRKKVFNSIFAMQVQVFNKSKKGEFFTTFDEDVKVFSNMLTQKILIFIDIGTALFIGLILFKINWILALILLVMFPVSLAIQYFNGKKLRDKEKELKFERVNFFTFIEEVLNGFTTIKMLGAEIRIKGKYFSILKSLYKIGISKVFINNLANTISQLSNFMGYLILLAVGVHQIQQGNLTLGGLVAFNAYSGSFRYSLLKISQVNAEIQQIIVSLKRVLDLVDRNKEKDQINKEKYVSFESPEMNIILRNLSFKYEASKPHIFKNLNIEIPSNKVTAIVGRSGIGKTTLLNIIMGLYKNYEGKIYINNVDYLNIPGSQLCQIISYVAQETFLLNDTIKENLLLAKPDAIDEELVEACKLSNIHEYINSLEKKYYTKLGPDGIQLSAGQRQRLAISRAVLRNAKIFLFDEITSALDVESEIFIKEMISQLSKNSTVVIVSHRLSTISEADNIIILKDNNVVEKLSINKTAEHYSHLQKLSKIIS